MRYAIVSDIHANRTALRAVEHVVKWLRRDGDVRYWLLGDLVGYGPASEAIECLQWLRLQSRIYNSSGEDMARWVPGNHDEWLASPAGRLRPGAEVTLYVQRGLLQESEKSDDRKWYTWFSEQVNTIVNDGNRSLPIVRENDSPDLVLAFTHGAAQRPFRRNHYLFPWEETKLLTDLAEFQQEMALRLGTVEARTICLLYGHTHFPVMARLDDGRICFESIRYGKPIPLGEGYVAINPGSVGQPRDGDPRASFAVLDTEARTVEFRRVEYDIQEVVAKLSDESNHSAGRQDIADALMHLDGKDPRGAGAGEQADYREKIRAAYTDLIRQLQEGNGGQHGKYYEKVYRRPEYDLIAMHHSVEE